MGSVGLESCPVRGCPSVRAIALFGVFGDEVGVVVGDDVGDVVGDGVVIGDEVGVVVGDDGGDVVGDCVVSDPFPVVQVMERSE